MPRADLTRRVVTRKGRVLPLIASLALLGTQAAWAGEPDVATLQGEVQALQTMVLQLNARVERLEGASPPATASTAAVSAPAKATALPATMPAAPVAVPLAAQPAPVAAPLAALQPGATPADLGPEALLRINWAKIDAAMPAGEVSALLGKPSKIFTVDGRTVWYYVYPSIGTGSVFFTGDNRVSSRHSPFGWGG